MKGPMNLTLQIHQRLHRFAELFFRFHQPDDGVLQRRCVARMRYRRFPEGDGDLPRQTAESLNLLELAVDSLVEQVCLPKILLRRHFDLPLQGILPR